MPTPMVSQITTTTPDVPQVQVTKLEQGEITMTYQNEFPQEYWPNQETVDTLELHGFTDASWHNDEYPSWRLGETEASLYINVTDDQMTGFVYCVLPDDSMITDYHTTNDLQDAITHYKNLTLQGGRPQRALVHRLTTPQKLETEEKHHARNYPYVPLCNLEPITSLRAQKVPIGK